MTVLVGANDIVAIFFLRTFGTGTKIVLKNGLELKKKSQIKKCFQIKK